MAFATDFNFHPGYLYYKGKDLKYYVSDRPNISHNLMKHISYKIGDITYIFTISDIASAAREVDGVTTYDACDCVEHGVNIGYSGMFNTVDTYGNDTFLKAGYNPHLILSGDTNTSLIYKTAYSGIKNNHGNNYNDLFQITRSDSKLAINKYYGSAGWREYGSIPANSFDQGLIPYVFMFYVQAAGGGGGPSYADSGGGGGGGGSAVIFMYNFNKGTLYILLGAPGKGGYYEDSPQGGSGSPSLIYNETSDFSIRVGAGSGASSTSDTDKRITEGGSGGKVSFGSMTLSAFNSTFKDTCFIMCYGNGGQGGNALTGEQATGATMTYTDAVTNYTFARYGGRTTSGGGGGGSPTSTGMTAPDSANNPGNSASDSDRGNGGSGASAKGLLMTSRAGGDGGTSEFQIWY